MLHSPWAQSEIALRLTVVKQKHKKSWSIASGSLTCISSIARGSSSCLSCKATLSCRRRTWWWTRGPFGRSWLRCSACRCLGWHCWKKTKTTLQTIQPSYWGSSLGSLHSRLLQIDSDPCPLVIIALRTVVVADNLVSNPPHIPPAVVVQEKVVVLPNHSIAHSLTCSPPGSHQPRVLP